MRKKGGWFCCCGHQYDKPRSEGGRCQAVPSCDDFRKPAQRRISANRAARIQERSAIRKDTLIGHQEAVDALAKSGVPSPTYHHRRSLFFFWNGKKTSVVDAARQLSIPMSTVYSRIYSLGWDVARAALTPKRAVSQTNAIDL